jgi:pimeloyl-ACP methyl ester carboxylesterase
VPAEHVASVAVPTLVMGGSKSPAPLRNAVASVADAVPNAQRLTLKGQTHNVALKVLAPVVEQFFGCN